MSKLENMRREIDKHQNDIELRSEKVRNIIGQMPQFLIRWGNTIIIFILVLLCIAAWVFNLFPFKIK